MSLRLTFCDTILRNAEEEKKTTNARSRSFVRRRSNPILELLNSHLLSRDEHNGQFIFTLKVFSCHDEIIACVLTLLAVMHALITLPLWTSNPSAVQNIKPLLLLGRSGFSTRIVYPGRAIPWHISANFILYYENVCPDRPYYPTEPGKNECIDMCVQTPSYL